MIEEQYGMPWAVLVTRNFPPLLGGMEKLNRHLLEALEPNWRTALCGPMGSSRFVMGTEVREIATRPLPRFLAGAFVSTLLLAIRCKPRLVIAGSGLTAPIAWLAARLMGARMVVYLHGLDVVAPNRIYRWLWLPFIRRSDLALVNSANTARLASENGVPVGRVQIVHPGTDLPDPDAALARSFREHCALAESPLLLSVGRLTRRKGLAEFVRVSLPVIVARRPGTVLLIIGEDAKDALYSHGGSERERIMREARTAGMEQNIRFLGHCDEHTLGAAYQACDVHVFPVRDLPGDVEGFGMVALEAAAHGLPTVAFAVGGVTDAVSDESTGRLVREGDYAAFADAVLEQVARARHESMFNSCRTFAASKTWPVFAQRITGLLAALAE
jgi:phosphatidylinositol alpha-1,6-mannosyltransferase